MVHSAKNPATRDTSHSRTAGSSISQESAPSRPCARQASPSRAFACSRAQPTVRAAASGQRRLRAAAAGAAATEPGLSI